MADQAQPQPRWRVILDGQDITGRIAPRLVALGITACRTDDADQLDLTVSDHDGILALPRHGVTVDVSLGWDTTGLTSMGTFTVDEIEHSGTPDKLVIRARSAKLASAIREKRVQSWHQLTVGSLVDQLAGRNGLTPRVAPSLASIMVDHIDQTSESDLNILTRIGKLYDAVATVKAGYLLFAPIGAGISANGHAFPTVRLTRADGDHHRYHVADRDAYTGVRAHWHSVGAAKKQSVIAGNKKTLKTLRTVYATEADAMHSAKAEWQRVQRGIATFALDLARGRADLYPEIPVRVSGFKPDIDATAWLASRVEHKLDSAGFTTSIECETADAPAPAIDTGAS